MTHSQTRSTESERRSAPTDNLGYLSASSLGAELTSDELNTLANNIELLKFSKNEILISEGSFDDHLYAIAQGIFSISRAGTRGQERLGMLGPGTITGELAFLDRLKRTATVTAENDECYAVALRREQLESLLSDHPVLVYKVMRAIVRSAHKTVATMDSTYVHLMDYISR